MSRRFALMGTWLTGTLFAMVLVAFSTSLVQARVSEHNQSLPVVQRQEVADQLADARADDATSSTTAPDDTNGADSSGGSDAEVPADATLPDGRTDPDDDDSASVTEAPLSGLGQSTSTVRPTTPNPPPSSPPPLGPPVTVDDHGNDDGGSGSSGGPSTTRPATTTTQTAPPPTSTREVHADGGWMVVRCTGSDATLLSYVAVGGDWTPRVVKWGPSEVEVEFRSTEHLSRLKAKCQDGKIDPEVDESDL